MNYIKIANSLVMAGYLDCDTNSKMYRVGKKVMRLKNKQLSGVCRFDEKPMKSDPSWLSAYNL